MNVLKSKLSRTTAKRIKLALSIAVVGVSGFIVNAPAHAQTNDKVEIHAHGGHIPFIDHVEFRTDGSSATISAFNPRTGPVFSCRVLTSDSSNIVMKGGESRTLPTRSYFLHAWQDNLGAQSNTCNTQVYFSNDYNLAPGGTVEGHCRGDSNLRCVFFPL